MTQRMWHVCVSRCFFFQAEDGIRDSVASRGLGMCIRDSGVAVGELHSKRLQRLRPTVWRLGVHRLHEVLRADVLADLRATRPRQLGQCGQNTGRPPLSLMLNVQISEERSLWLVNFVSLPKRRVWTRPPTIYNFLNSAFSHHLASLTLTNQK